MTWLPTQTSADEISETEWNQMTQCILNISANAHPGSVSSQKMSGGTILTHDIYIYGDTISGLRDPTYPSAASNKHYTDTISGNLRTSIGAGVLRGSLVANIGSNYTYGTSGLKFVSSQAISGQWKMPIFRTGKPAASVTWDRKMIMSSGSTGNKARIWVCCKNDDGSTYDWIQIAVGN